MTFTATIEYRCDNCKRTVTTSSELFGSLPEGWSGLPARFPEISGFFDSPHEGAWGQTAKHYCDRCVAVGTAALRRALREAAGS